MVMIPDKGSRLRKVSCSSLTGSIPSIASANSGSPSWSHCSRLWVMWCDLWPGSAGWTWWLAPPGSPAGRSSHPGRSMEPLDIASCPTHHSQQEALHILCQNKINRQKDLIGQGFPIPDTRAVAIVVRVREVEDCIWRRESLGGDSLDFDILNILQPDGPTKLIVEQPELLILLRNEHSHHLTIHPCNTHLLNVWRKGESICPDDVVAYSLQTTFIRAGSWAK